MKGLKALGCVVAFTPLLAGCQASPVETSSPFERSEDSSAGSVRRIIDGDTVVVVTGGSETTIRLAGVNAPEKNECFFGESTDYLVETVEGATVEIENLGTDQFGRTLAYLWEGPSLLNLDLVAGGWAIATTPGEEDQYGKEILAAEKKAVAAAAGLWATDACGSAAEIPKIGISAAPNPPGPDSERLSRRINHTHQRGSRASRHLRVDPEGRILDQSLPVRWEHHHPAWSLNQNRQHRLGVDARRPSGVEQRWRHGDAADGPGNSGGPPSLCGIGSTRYLVLGTRTRNGERRTE